MLDAGLGFGKPHGASWGRENKTTNCLMIALLAVDTPLRASVFFPEKQG